MKTQHISQQGDNLIVYFAGWGTPPSVVEHLILPENYDLCLCYDYRDLHCDVDFPLINIFAWWHGQWACG